jgi:hypothetical protein
MVLSLFPKDDSLGAVEEVPQSDTAYFPVAPFEKRH